jgi:hypothetical protein
MLDSMTERRPRLQIDLPDEYRWAVRVFAAEADITPSQAVMRALDSLIPEYVARGREKIRQEGPPPKSPRGRKPRSG